MTGYGDLTMIGEVRRLSEFSMPLLRGSTRTTACETGETRALEADVCRVICWLSSGSSDVAEIESMLVTNRLSSVFSTSVASVGENNLSELFKSCAVCDMSGLTSPPKMAEMLSYVHVDGGRLGLGCSRCRMITSVGDADIRSSSSLCPLSMPFAIGESGGEFAGDESFFLADKSVRCFAHVMAGAVQLQNVVVMVRRLVLTGDESWDFVAGACAALAHSLSARLPA